MDTFKYSFDLPNHGLKMYFNRVRSGADVEYRTTFYKGRNVQNVLSEWSKTLNTIKRDYPQLLDFENDLRKKVGPMSIMFPLSQRLDDIDHYYDDILLPSVDVSQQALDDVVEYFSSLRGLKVRDQYLTNELMKKSTNSGSPFFTKKKFVQDKTLPCKVWLDTDMDQVKQMLKGKEWYAPAILGWRGQEGGPNPEDVKQRVVWMFPYSVNVLELSVYQPLIEQCQQHKLVPSWISMELVDEYITKMFDSKDPTDLIVGTDFSRFDQHFNPAMQRAAQYILTELMDDSEVSRQWLDDVFPVKYEIQLAYDWMKTRSGSHGMGSGSGGTNADETLVHKALQFECARRAGKTLNPYSQCLGDDGILTYPGISVDAVVDSYSAHGQVMNVDKQYASANDCIYLRRWHHEDYRINDVCVGVYSTYRALGRLCEQERYYDPDSWGPKAVALRQLSIIENVKYHPLREQFADFCIKGDKYRLGIDIPGFLDNIDRIAKEHTDKMPDFLGYTKTQMPAPSGLKDWWIVNYLKSYR